MSITVDPLDIGEPRQKAWEEFRVSFAAALQHLWLIDELDDVAPDYFDELHTRFIDGFGTADALRDMDRDYEGDVPLQAASGHGVWFIPREDAEDLFDQLFPDGKRPARELTAAFGLATVGLHAALEAYVRSLDIDVRRTSLPSAICGYLRRLTPPRDLDAEIADDLVECDATRHIVAHNRGVVDPQYIDSVKNNKLQLGERKPLDFNASIRFAKAIWRSASCLRASVT